MILHSEAGRQKFVLEKKFKAFFNAFGVCCRLPLQGLC